MGFPPPAGTRRSPVVALLVATMMVASSTQLAPRGAPGSWASVIGAPPLTATFFNKVLLST